MATPTQIRDGLKANLAGIAGLQVTGYVQANPTPPVAEFLPAKVEYDKTAQRGSDEWTWTIRVLVGNVSDIGAQKRLDTFLAPSGAGSIKAQVQSDRKLGGTVDTLRVTRCSGYRAYDRPNGTTLLGAEWTVEITT